MASQNEKVSPATDRKSVSLTIYNDEIVLIREEREISVDAGFNRVAIPAEGATTLSYKVQLRW